MGVDAREFQGERQAEHAAAESYHIWSQSGEPGKSVEGQHPTIETTTDRFPPETTDHSGSDRRGAGQWQEDIGATTPGIQPIIDLPSVPHRAPQHGQVEVQKQELQSEPAGRAAGAEQQAVGCSSTTYTQEPAFDQLLPNVVGRRGSGGFVY